jgi:hypothetical protein
VLRATGLWRCLSHETVSHKLHLFALNGARVDKPNFDDNFICGFEANDVNELLGQSHRLHARVVVASKQSKLS